MPARNKVQPPPAPPRPAPAPAGVSSSQQPRLAFRLATAAALVLLTVLAYEPVRNNGFVYDDDLYVLRNPQVQAGLTGPSIVWAFTTGDASNWHPLTWLSLELDFELFGLKPLGYHLTNLALHVANALLLLLVLWKMTRAWWRSTLVAALFALHPLHVESVAWVSERKDVLSTFFGLLALWAYAAYVGRPGLGRYALILLAYLASLLAKPMLVTLPFVLLLLDWWPLGRVARSGYRATTRRDRATAGGDRATTGGDHTTTERDRATVRATIRWLVVEKIPLLLLAAASSVATWAAQERGGSVVRLGRFPWSIRIGNAVESYVVYLRKTFWPADLSAFYPHPYTSLVPLEVAAAALLLMLVTGLVWWLRRRAPYLAVGWFWYLGTLVPVLGLVQVGAQAYADRYTYFPLIGIFLALTWGGLELAGRLARIRDLLIGAAGVLLLVLVLLTWYQVHHWRNGITLWEQALMLNPHNAMAHTNYALALLAEEPFSKVEPDAFAHLKEAVSIEPTQIAGNTGLGMLELKRGQIPEAVERFRLVVRLEPQSPDAQYRLGYALARAGDYAQAEPYLRRAVQLAPQVPYLEALAAVYAELGRFDDAVTTQRQANELARLQGRGEYQEKGEKLLNRYQRGR